MAYTRFVKSMILLLMLYRKSGLIEVTPVKIRNPAHPERFRRGRPTVLVNLTPKGHTKLAEMEALVARGFPPDLRHYSPPVEGGMLG